MACGPNLTSHLFLQIKFYWDQPSSLVYVWSVVAFTPRRRSWVIAIVLVETGWPSEPEMLTAWPFLENPWSGSRSLAANVSLSLVEDGGRTKFSIPVFKAVTGD